jgi:hypothetical protein
MKAKHDRRVEFLLAELCAKLGYCSANREVARFEGLVASGANEFARAVIAVEKADQDSNAAGQVHALVKKHFQLWVLRA